MNCEKENFSMICTVLKVQERLRQLGILWKVYFVKIKLLLNMNSNQMNRLCLSINNVEFHFIFLQSKKIMFWKDIVIKKQRNSKKSLKVLNRLSQKKEKLAISLTRFKLWLIIKYLLYKELIALILYSSAMKKWAYLIHRWE